MLEKMLTLGVRNCSWVHSLTMNTTNKDSESEKTVKNFFTRPLLLRVLLALLLPELVLRACFEILGRSAIFEIEGVDEQGLTEEEKAGLLEEILSISERNFGHNRTYVANEKYPQLSKYLFAYIEGVVLETGAEHSRVLQSDANLKKNVKSLADMQHGQPAPPVQVLLRQRSLRALQPLSRS